MMNHTCQAYISPILQGFFTCACGLVLNPSKSHTLSMLECSMLGMLLNVAVKTAAVFKLENVL